MKHYTFSLALLAATAVGCKDEQPKKIVEPATEVVEQPVEETIAYEQYITPDGKVLYVFIDELNNQARVRHKGEELILDRIPSGTGLRYGNGSYKLSQLQGITSLKRGEELLFEQRPELTPGYVVLGHEVSAFRPCGTERDFWLHDMTPDLQRRYVDLTKNIKDDYQRVYVELEVVELGRPRDGFGASYDGQYRASKLKSIRLPGARDCK